MKKIKKAIALSLSAILALGSVACNNKPSEKTDGSGSLSSSKEVTEGSNDSKERMTLTIQSIDFNAGASNTGEHAEEVLKGIQDHTGVNLDIDWVLNDVLSEKITLYLTNPATMPMILTHGGALSGQIASAAKAGAFIDLNQYIWDEEKYPNLSQLDKNVAASLTVDGKLIAFPRARDIGRYGLSYRQDWAEAVGITEEPKTVEDVYEMLHKFTYDDPDGNGKDDTFGLEMTQYTGPFDIMQTWFGVGNGWYEDNGILKPIHLQPEYKEALNWFRKIYEEGLMPSDWPVRTTDTWSNGTKTGEAGVYVDVMDGGRRIWDYFVAEETYTPSVVNPDEPASMNLLGPINDKTLATSGYNGYFTLSAKTLDTEEKIEAALTFMDKMSDNEMLILAEYGIEGIHWKEENGFMVDLDLEKPELANNYAGFNQMLSYIPNSKTVPPLEQNERRKKEDEVKKSNEDFAVFNPALSYLISSETYAKSGASLEEIITQARTQYIAGEIDETGLDEAFNQWAKQGGQAIIDEVNANYKG
jgi:putative aldouronate transport system substrate-binding protein